MSDFIRISRDNTWIFGFARKDFMRLREMLRNPKMLSRRITLTELANVVTWREDIKLPTWCHDRCFEAELQSLIDKNELVWVCPHCDSIVGFFATDKAFDVRNLSRGLLFVAQRESIPCPFCGECEISICSVEMLREGMTLDGQPALFEDETLSRDRTDCERETAEEKQGGSGDEFLEEVLRKHYGMSEDEHPDFMSPLGTPEGICRSLTETIRSWQRRPRDDVSLLSSSNIPVPADLPLLNRIELRPSETNVLGRIWDSVLLMTRSTWPQVDNVSVAVAKCNGLGARAFRRQQDGKCAIVLHYGLFDLLYLMNHLFDRILFYDESSSRGFDALIDEFIRVIKAVNARRSSYAISWEQYRSEKEFLKSHFISNCQQQFVILHEVAHLATGFGGGTEDVDAEADSWALQIVIEKGEMFYEPWLQYRSIFWLFEYWHLLSKGEGLDVGNLFAPRARWDVMHERLDGCGAPLSGLHVDEVRSFLDTITPRLWR